MLIVPQWILRGPLGHFAIGLVEGPATHPPRAPRSLRENVFLSSGGRGPWRSWRSWRSWRENAFLSSGGWGPLRPWRTLRENAFLPLCLPVFGWAGASASIVFFLIREICEIRGSFLALGGRGNVLGGRGLSSFIIHISSFRRSAPSASLAYFARECLLSSYLWARGGIHHSRDTCGLEHGGEGLSLLCSPQ